jgi:hypothetical protein
MSVSTIESAWSTALATTAIKAYTPNVILYEYTQGSTKEIAPLKHNQRLNFIECIVSERQQFDEVGASAASYYEVRVAYTREKDTDGDNYRSIRDFFSTLLSTVSTSLGTSWSATVDYYTPPESVPNISRVIITDIECFRGETIYTAVLG